ncbi:MAG: redox-sensing transcriptional repressor Rex [Candidatus Omnitrophica bacterium]|nr:redox-sensing transcriptional repressor Rex [Candidatus Omnitrophota bacterium]
MKQNNNTIVKKKKIPFETIKRLSLYLRTLKNQKQTGKENVLSSEITKYLNITPEQFRKDLSYFGSLGKKGVGYNINLLIGNLETILGIYEEPKIALVGVGKLGSALLGYPGFLNFNLKVYCAFDTDLGKIGKVWEGVKIEDISKIDTIIPEQNIKIAIITVPADFAQGIAEKLVNSGIKGILNFAPVNLNLPKDILVRNVDMASELMTLTYIVKKM